MGILIKCVCEFKGKPNLEFLYGKKATKCKSDEKRQHNADVKGTRRKQPESSALLNSLLHKSGWDFIVTVFKIMFLMQISLKDTFPKSVTFLLL